MQKVSVVACLKAKAGLAEKAGQELMMLVEASRKEKGCLNYDLHVDIADPESFVFYENWVSRMALANHMETSHFLRLQALEAELFHEPAKIRILKMMSEPE
jgi:quinol monooxygenase YgiN